MLAGPSREEMSKIESLDLREVHRAELAEVDGLFDVAIPNWYFENLGVGSGVPVGNAQLAERVWVANRCQQMNAQQVANMPLEFFGSSEPAWVSSPDPNLFPNGIGDAIHAAVEQIYGWGFSCQYVTDFYADGYPRTWTVLDSARLDITIENGVRVYRPMGGRVPLDSSRIVQIDRNPSARRAHGTSALRAYAEVAFGLLHSNEQALSVNAGGVPQFYLKAKRPINEVQADKISNRWAEKTAQRGGRPPVLPPDIDAEQMSINPEDLALLGLQEFGSRVVATAYGVPSVLLNMALQGGLTYQNPAALGEMWWRFELRNMATKIANALSAQMLPRGQYVAFRAEDTFAALTPQSSLDDEQQAIETPPPASAQASPTQQASGRLAAV